MTDLHQQIAALTPAQRALFEQRLKQREIQPSVMPILPRTRRQSSAELPLSFAQQRLWFIQQLDPQSVVYNVPSALRLRGHLNFTALEQTFNALLQRHETLRTRFQVNADKQPVQIVAAAQPIDLPIVDLSALADAASIVEQLALTAAQRPFNLSQSLLRSVLLRLNPTEHLLLLTTHHIISDRWSIGIFLREMSQLYNYFHHSHGSSSTETSPLPALPIQYADWAIWQRQTLQGEHLAAEVQYWQQQLQDLTVLELPTDHARPAMPSYRGAAYPLQLSPSLTADLKKLSAQAGTTLFILLLAAFQTLLYRYTQQDDITIGTDVANRERPETSGLIGLLVNTLVLRGDLSGDPTFRELLQRTRQMMAGALSHQDLPFEKLVELLNPERHLSQMMPLFQVKLDFQLAEVKPLTLAGLAVERLPFDNGTVKYDLRLNLQDGEQGINGQVEYSSDLFEVERIARLVEHFRILLEAIVTNPAQRLSELALLTPAEQQQLQQWHDTHHDYPSSLIHDLFTAQLNHTPDRIALLWHHQQLSYSTLNAQANQLAHLLQALGAAPETRIGICLSRTPALVIAILATLKAGAAYVPLDPSYPTERLCWIAQDAAISILITDSQMQTIGQHNQIVVNLDKEWEKIASYPISPVETTAAPSNLAYIIYTSGSTGVPKGVAVEHRSTVAFLHWVRETYSAKQLAVVLAATSICFDLSIFELFAPLSWGGTIVLADSILQLPQLLQAHHLTLLNTVPSVISQLLRLHAIPTNIRTINLAGEALTASLVEQIHRHTAVHQLYNLYGPSEDTTYSTYTSITATGATPTIGQPISNSQAHILDSHLQPLPIGVPGELYLSGAGLARGYLNRPELSAERFLPNPFSAAARLYKTGDLARYRSDGSIEYLGRLDQQVKLRGFRIELGEIESVLLQHPQVSEAVVVVQSEQLFAYWVATSGKEIGADPGTDIGANSGTNSGTDSGTGAETELRQFVSTRLPAYMIPVSWIALSELPRLPSGKLNRSALPQAQPDRATFAPPTTTTEQTIAAIWQTELQLAAIGRDDNFFELGGHSLLAMTVMARISEALGVELPLRALFQAPTVAGLAAQVSPDSLGPISSISQSFPIITAAPQQRYQPFPLTEIQQAYWVGRNEVFELGNVSTHGYREIEVSGLTVAQVEQAIQHLIDRHEMLRVIVQSDGQQRILAEVPSYQINTLDLRGCNTAEAQLTELRNQLSHQVLSTDIYPLFNIQAVLLDNQKIRFSVSFDVLIGDAWSFQILGQELVQLLQHQALTPLSLSFRDYVLAERSWRNSDAYQRSVDYWQQQLANLPSAPELPLAQSPSAITQPHFSRRSGQLDAPLWQALKQRASQHNLTPSGLLLAVFAEVLATWSRTPQFTLNLTLFNRLPLHPEVNQIVGDFTASTLLAVDCSRQNNSSGQDSFSQRAQRLQAQLWQDLDHRYVSGVAVLRQLARQQQQTTRALMPVVFTSILALDKRSVHRECVDRSENYSYESSLWQSEVVYSLSQTSQVYLDHQVAEVNEALIFNWDTIDELFPSGLLDQMFAAYSDSLEQLVRHPDWQTPLSIQPVQPVTPALSEVRVESANLLHTLFLDRVKLHPNHLAIIAPEQQFTYQELADRAHQLAYHLQQQGISTDSIVAVVMEKGWEQIVAVLGILMAGAAYLPVEPSLPADRRNHLLQQTEACYILTQSWLDASLTWADAVPRLNLDLELPLSPAFSLPLSSPQSLAYIIYTSGSTGRPKGVMISHQAAVNTILDINQRFRISISDRMLAVSSLSFDLSVYDIFGSLAAGSTLVIPDAKLGNDPAHWAALIQAHRITVWNSVPALMSLLVQQPNSLGSPTQSSLRLIMLSGDWIPLALPNQICQRCPNAEVISLGGATEAAIWSIFYPVTEIDPNWTSIPYGHALTNQQVYVLNHALLPCPTWVIGQLYIGGSGLAQGYWRDPERTNASFIQHPSLGRLYCTGDLGRYLPGGEIEFLGREDFQVKLNGYRVELGEIEAALQQHPAIQAAVVTGENQQLVAYVVPDIVPTTARVEFKLQQRRRLIDVENKIPLPISVDTPDIPDLRRQSYRQFLSEQISLIQLSQFLSALQQFNLADSPLPKYHYASAGSLYPVETYLLIKPEQITGLTAGIYYYDAKTHSLEFLNSLPAAPIKIYGSNQIIFEQAAFSLFLIGQLAAITPLYGDKSRDFCLLEAGYMGQLLMQTAPDYGLGLCPIGTLEFAEIAPAFALTENHCLLHSFVGGAIDPVWTTEWSAQASAPQTNRSLLEQLRQFLRQKLPAYMVPHRFVFLDTLPLSANGKVDRQALTQPICADSADRPSTAPQTDIEQTIAAIWQQALHVEAISIYDNFFDLGGNSLSATQVLTQMRQAFQCELSIRQFFTAATVAEQAELIQTSTALTDRSQPIDLPIPRLDRGIDPEQIKQLDELSDQAVEAMLQHMLVNQPLAVETEVEP